MRLPATAARILADALAPSLARWSEAREREILANGRPLPAVLLPFARDLGILDPGAVRIEVRPRVPLPLASPLVSLARRLGFPVFHPLGMTLGRGISARNLDESLIRHELVHVHQYQRFGGHVAFMGQYLFECLSSGYAAAPLEIEARERSAAR